MTSTTFWDWITSAFLKIPFRLLSDRDFLSWRWIVSCLVVASVTTLLFSPNLRRSWRRLTAHTTSSRLKKELALDLKFLAMKIFYDIFKLAFFGALIITITKSIEKGTQPMWSKILPQHYFIFDDFYGGIAFGLFTLLVWDLGYYVFHKVSHDWPVMWELHSVHHRARYLTPLTKYRDHPVSDIINNLFTAVIVGLGMAVFTTIVQTPKTDFMDTPLKILVLGHYFFGHLRHSHYWISFGPLNYIFISPAMHQIHHSRRTQHLGKNLGVIFSVWDQMFGTLYVPRKKEKLLFGLDPLIDSSTRGFWQEIIIPMKDSFTHLSKYWKSTSPATHPLAQPVAVPVAHHDRTKQSGFTLIELMVSMPAAVIMILAMGAVVLTLYAMSTRTITNITAEQELNLMVNSLRSVARAGINVRYFKNPLGLGGTSSVGSEGYVDATYDYQSFSDLAGPIMYFARETAFDTRSAPRATALFFVAPNPTTPGQLQLTLATAAGTATMSPCPVTGACTANPRPTIFLNNVVGVKMFDPQYSPNAEMLDSVKMEITTRVFVASSDKPRMYCPAANWATYCSQGGPYRDFVRTFVLQFDNNRRESLTPGFDFPFGAYFFRATGPRWYSK